MRGLALCLLLAAGCGGAVRVDADAEPPSRLSAFGFFTWSDDVITYRDGMVPYDLNTPLFSDHAQKERAIYIPEGEAAVYADDGVMTFPEGTAIVKSFLFPADLRAPDQDRRLVETRVLLKGSSGWKAYPYLWDEAQRDATLALGGAVIDMRFLDATGQPLEVAYLVPQKNQCLDCHELKNGEGRDIVPIGPKARHMNRSHDYDGTSVNQLQHLADLGLLTGLPPLDQVDHAVDAAALDGVDLDTLSYEEITVATRDYLDINCAHCHNPEGSEGVASQLFLNWDNDDPFSLGVCKKPGSAGNGTGGLVYDVVPGRPDRSILHFRMDTEELGSMMPDIGRGLRHAHGVDLVARWIRGLDHLGITCSGEATGDGGG